MDDHDVRDLGGRSWRLVVACVIGCATAVVLALGLPGHDHFPVHWHTCFGGGDSIALPLVAAGAVGLSIAVFAGLEAVAKRVRRALASSRRLPRAVVVARR